MHDNTDIESLLYAPPTLAIACILTSMSYYCICDEIRTKFIIALPDVYMYTDKHNSKLLDMHGCCDLVEIYMKELIGKFVDVL